MKPSDSITKAFIQHKGEIILKNGPLERLAGDSLYCFHRLMDVFFQEGPGDKRPTNWWCVLDSVLRRNPGKATFINKGSSYTIVMSNTEWTPVYRETRGPLWLNLTVPARGWTYKALEYYLGSNVGSILAIDKFMPDIVRQAEIISMLAKIKLTISKKR